MKTQLTIEESARLIELGVDAKLASATIVTDEYNEQWENFQHPIFGLTDILSILPKEIKHKGDPYGLDMNWDDNWEVSYFNAINFVTPYKEGSIAFEIAPELIDALNQLAIWVITNGNLKTEKK